MHFRQLHGQRCGNPRAPLTNSPHVLPQSSVLPATRCPNLATLHNSHSFQFDSVYRSHRANSNSKRHKSRLHTARLKSSCSSSSRPLACCSSEFSTGRCSEKG